MAALSNGGFKSMTDKQTANADLPERARRVGTLANEHAGYGDDWAWNRQGQAFRVPHEGERELTKLLVAWRHAHVDWPEIRHRTRRSRR